MNNSEEMVMISSHHDSAFKGATEDGTGVAMVLAIGFLILLEFLRDPNPGSCYIL